MKLYRIGNKVLNLERLNGIIDVSAPDGPEGSHGETVLRLYFDQGEIDISGKEAEVLRRWYRHASYNLAPHKDEHGEELISPEDQVRESIEALVARIDKGRHGDLVLRRAAHQVKVLAAQFITGELQPARVRDFHALFEEARTEG
jgi:hypothetical protein